MQSQGWKVGQSINLRLTEDQVLERAKSINYVLVESLKPSPRISGRTSPDLATVTDPSHDGTEELPILGSNANMQRMLKNIEQLRNMNIVGGSQRLGQLVDLMNNQSKKMDRLKNIRKQRLANKPQFDGSLNDDALQIKAINVAPDGSADEIKIKPQSFEEIQEVISAASQIQGNGLDSVQSIREKKPKLELDFDGLKEDFEEIKRRSNINVVIKASPSKIKADGESLNLRNLKNVPSVQQLTTEANIPDSAKDTKRKIIESGMDDQKYVPLNSAIVTQDDIGKSGIRDTKNKSKFNTRNLSMQIEQMPSTAFGMLSNKASGVKLPKLSLAPVSPISSRVGGNLFAHSPSRNARGMLDSSHMMQDTDAISQSSAVSARRLKSRNPRTLKPLMSYASSKRNSKKSLLLAQDIQDTQSQTKQDIDYDKFQFMSAAQIARKRSQASNAIQLKKGLSPQMAALGQLNTLKPKMQKLKNETNFKKIDSIKSMFDGRKNKLSNINLQQSRVDTEQGQISNISSVQHIVQSPSFSNINIRSPMHQDVKIMDGQDASLNKGVSHSLLQASQGDSKQSYLMEMFDKRLKDLGVQKNMIDQIMLKGGDNDMVRDHNRTQVGNIQGDIQTFQAMVTEQDLKDRMGGHMGSRLRRPSQVVSPLDIRDQISQQHKQQYQVADVEREERRLKATNQQKHGKAIALIEQVENQIRQKKGLLRHDLSMKPRKKVNRDDSADTDYANNRQKEFEFQQFNNSDNDSDFADKNVLDAVKQNFNDEGHEAKKPEGPIQPFRGTKYEKLITMPGQEHEKFTKCVDGSVKYSDQQKTFINDKSKAVDERVIQKKEFEKVIKQKQDDQGFIADIVQTNVDGTTFVKNMKELVEAKDKTKLYQTDFEVKAQHMNQAVQPTLDEIDKQLAFDKDAFKPPKEPLEMVADAERLAKEEAERKRKVLQIKILEEPLTEEMSVKEDDTALDEKEQVAMQKTLEHSIESSLERVNEPPIDTGKYLVMMTGWKKRAIKQALLEKQAARKKRRRDPGSALRSQESPGLDQFSQDSLHNKYGHLLDEPDDPFETFDQKQKRLTLEAYQKMAHLPQEERKLMMAKKQMEVLKMTPEVVRIEKIKHKLQTKITWDQEFPIDTINKMIILKINEMEQKFKTDYTDENLTKNLAQDEVINGLCMLKCLKSEENAHKDLLSNEEILTEQSVNNMIKAASAVKTFKIQEVEEDHQTQLHEFLSKKNEPQTVAHYTNYNQESKINDAPSLSTTIQPSTGQPTMESAERTIDDEKQKQEKLRIMSNAKEKTKDSKQIEFNSMLFNLVLQGLLKTKQKVGLTLSKQITDKFEKGIQGVSNLDQDYASLKSSLKELQEMRMELQKKLEVQKKIDDKNLVKQQAKDMLEQLKTKEVLKQAERSNSMRGRRNSGRITSARKNSESPDRLSSPSVNADDDAKSDAVSEKPLPGTSGKYQELYQELVRTNMNIKLVEGNIKAKQNSNAMDYSKLDRGEQSIQLFARRINLQNEFFQMCKHSQNAKVELVFDNNPIMYYFKECELERSLVLPLLNKISSKQLNLINYSLNEGHCSALGKAFQGNTKLITSITLDNNTISDRAFAKLLEGLKQLHSIKNITYRRNELGHESVQQLIEVFQRKKPGLESFRLISAKMTSSALSSLMTALYEHASLKKLAIVDHAFSEQAFDTLIDYLRVQSRTLRYLDLSCNGFRPTQGLILMENLAENRRLEYCDLSWNSIQYPELTFAPSSLEGCGIPGVNKMTRAERKHMERTIGQFTMLSQEEVLKHKKEGWRKYNLEILQDEKFSRKLNKINNQTDGGSIIPGPVFEDEAPVPQVQPENQEGEVPAEEGGEPKDDEGQEGEDKGEDAEDAKEEKKAKEEEKEHKPKGPFTMADEIERQKELIIIDHNKALKLYLSRFIKYNQNLVKFNLSHAGLTLEMIRKIGISMNKSRALCCMGLNGNPGVNDASIEFIQGRINCKDKLFGLQPILDKQHVQIHFQDPEDAKAEKNMNKLLNKSLDRHVAVDQIKEKHMGKDLIGKKHLIEENMKLASIKNSMRITNDNPTIKEQKSIDNEKKLNIVRYLGFHYDMPGSAQWEIQNNHFDTSERCWIDEQWCHTLVFWSKSIANFNPNIRPAMTKFRTKIMNQITKYYPRIEPLKIKGDMNQFSKLEKKLAQAYLFYEDDLERPFICNEFTKWKPIRMLKIEEYCMAIESTTREGKDFFDILRDKGNINPNGSHKDISKLDEDDQEEFAKEKEKLLKRYEKSWFDSIATDIKYKRPQIINSEFFQQLPALSEDPLYVFPCFLRPGRQNYVVIQQDELANQNESVLTPDDDEDYYIHKTIICNRVEDIIEYRKPMKTVKKERKFKHETSIWKPWRPDKPDVYDAIIAHDIETGYAKLPRFVKPETEVPAVIAVLRKHMKVIKDKFHFLISKSQYPAIREFEYTEWVRQIKCVDAQMDQSAIERDFKATNFQPEDLGLDYNPGNALCRFEFLEILTRMATSRFKERGKADSLPQSECLEKLITEHIIKHDLSDSWQVWREKQLWTLPVCDTMEPNMENLKTIYDSFLAPRKPYMDIKDCYEIFFNKTKLLTMEKYVAQCFGMSKMTVVAESKEYRKYFNLQFIEFCEMLGRVAYFKFKEDAEMHKQPLQTKIEFVMDELLPAYGFTRIEPEVKELDESESDDEY